MSLLASPSGAQGTTGRIHLPAQDPGAVVTVAVPVPEVLAGRADSALAFAVELGPGVRLLGAPTGRVLASPGVVLRLTCALGRSQSAGPLDIATVTFTSASGVASSIVAETYVRARRALTATLTAEPETIAPGGRTRLRYALHNGGNAADTVRLDWETPSRWRVLDGPRALVLAPGERAERAALLEASGDARAGDAHAIALMVSGVGGAKRPTVVVRVTSYGGVAQEHVRLPASAFIGTGKGADGRPAFTGAFTASGEPFRSTRLEVAVRTSGGVLSSPAFVGDVAGPRALVSIRRPTWAASAGDVGLSSAGLLGGPLGGRGVAGEARRGLTRVSGLGAVSHGNVLASPLWQGYIETETRTRLGTVGALAAALYRPADLFSGSAGVQALGARYVLPASAHHRLRATVGVMRERSITGGSSLGPALDAAYSYASARASVNARLRRVPTALPTGEVLPDETAIGAAGRLTKTVHVHGWASSTRLELPSSAAFMSDGAALGANWMRRGTRIGMVGAYRHSGAASSGGLPSQRASLTFSGGLPAGPFALNASVEGGRKDDGNAVRALRVVRAGLRWRSRQGWVQASVTRRVGESSQASTFSTVNGALTLRRVQFGAGGSATHRPGLSGGIAGWLRADVAISPRLSFVAAVETEPSRGAGRVRLSAGLRQRFSVPLPLASPPAMQGVVFDDANGNGRRDPGEAGLEGVTINVGRTRVETDERGRWAVLDPGAEGQTPVLDPTTLPPGALVGEGGRARGRSWTPVARAASLTLVLFDDANGNGLHDGGEVGLPQVHALLRDSSGAVRYAVSDADGIARITGLVSGPYTLVLQRRAVGIQAPVERSTDVSLEAGKGKEISFAAPATRRPVRFASPSPLAIVPAATAPAPDVDHGEGGNSSTSVATVEASFGLRGAEPIRSGDAGWTVIVGGGTARADAEALARSFRERGIRAGVLPGVTARGAPLYRVGVGLFEDAPAARAELRQWSGELFPFDAWVMAIR